MFQPDNNEHALLSNPIVHNLPNTSDGRNEDDGRRTSPAILSTTNPIPTTLIPRHTQLPQLSIPTLALDDELSSQSSRSEPDTPASVSSPIAGVVDLTKYVKTKSTTPITAGGFSDIYQGEWERRISLKDGAVKYETVKVAIKLLRVLTSRDQEGVKARKRLNREVYIWHRLEHPNIVTFYGTSYHIAGRPSMVMQWYKNGSASEYLKSINPEANREKLVLDVAQGLAYLHTLKPPIVHGDLKGNNVLITDEGRAVLSDFGLSQVIEDLVGPTGYTPSNPEIGPHRWQAPDLLLDETCRPRLPTDVWSFGCTAFELLTGKLPYPHRLRDVVVIQDILRGVKPPGPDGLPDEARSVRYMLDRCWTLDPRERIQMPDVLRMLEGITYMTDY